MKIKYILTSLSLVISMTSVLSQSDAQRKYISENTNPKFKELAKQEIDKYNEERLARINEYLLSNDVPVKYRDSVGNLVVLEDITPEGEPLYLKTHNFSGVLTIGADELYPSGGLGLNITGSGYEAGIWDGGYTRQSHQDLQSRVTYAQSGSSIDGHATHVGGTIIGDGTGGTSRRGVAFAATLKSYDFNNDTNEMLPEASNGMILSNHSYGLQLNSNLVFLTGKYDDRARAFDVITSLNPYYLPVVSAGNDRNDGFNTADQGYDLITDRSIAKNVISVGAVNSVINYNGPSSVVMSSFSSWGPADDGRIKPDIVAKGVGVNSTESTSDTAYGVRSGTSMASPMVTGGILLLHELYGDLNPGAVLTAASMKGLVLATTKEAGLADGPDYRFGWGLMDVERAAEVMLSNNNSSLISELTLNNNNTYTRSVTSNQNVLKVALSWTDPFGSNNSNSPEDDPTPALVNDLDLKLTDSNGNDYFPWKLNVNNFTAPATKGINNVDNIEIVEIEAPAGNYTLTVNHKGNLRGGSPQDYSLIILGADPGTLTTPSEVLDTVKIYPNPANDFVNIAMNGQLSGSKITVTVHDILGKQVINKNFDNSSSFQERIDISTLKSGVYLMNVSDGRASTTKKLIVK